MTTNAQDTAFYKAIFARKALDRAFILAVKDEDKYEALHQERHKEAIKLMKEAEDLGHPDAPWHLSNLIYDLTSEERYDYLLKSRNQGSLKGSLSFAEDIIEGVGEPETIREEFELTIKKANEAIDKIEQDYRQEHFRKRVKHLEAAFDALIAPQLSIGMFRSREKISVSPVDVMKTSINKGEFRLCMHFIDSYIKEYFTNNEDEIRDEVMEIVNFFGEKALKSSPEAHKARLQEAMDELDHSEQKLSLLWQIYDEAKEDMMRR